MNLYPILEELLRERKRVDRLIHLLESFEAGDLPTIGKRPGGSRGRKSMSKQERQDVSRRMREFWASRRKDGRGGESEC